MNASTLPFNLGQPWSGLVPHGSIVPNPDQPRKWFDPENMEHTAASLETLQVQPILVIPHTEPGLPAVRWMIVDGERRWRALGTLKQKEVLVCYRPGITRDNLHATSFAANFCRQGHTHAETAIAIDKELQAGRNYGEIAKMVGRTEQWARNEHKLLKLHPKLLALMDPPTPKDQKLSTKLALLLADLPPFDQLGRYQRVKEMPSSDAFHKLRTSVGVSQQSQRDPSKDADYLIGKCTMAQNALNAVAVVPVPMLKRIGDDKRKAILQGITRAETALKAARERMEG